MRIFITGVGCVGKTIIGAKLAALLNCSFFDLDDEIEKFFSMPIEFLQDKFSTMYSFREEASKALDYLLKREDSQNSVIALPPSGLMHRYWRVIKKTTDIGDQFRMSVSTAEWNKKGAALSDKSARKEFGLTQEQIIGAINSGKLQYRQNYIHGNPYFRLLRDEVEELAKELIGLEKLKHTQIQNELSQVNREINKLKRQLKVLEKRKTELSSLINEKDFS